VQWRRYLSEDDWTLLAQDARWETYDRGEIIVEQGSYAREILILTRGTARLEKESRGGRVSVIGELMPDDLYGEEAFAEGKPFPFGLVASGDEVEILMLELAHLKPLFLESPGLSERFHQYIAAVHAERSFAGLESEEPEATHPLGGADYPSSQHGEPEMPSSRGSSRKLAEEEQPSFERGHLYETRLQAALNKLNKAVKDAMTALTPYQLKEVLHCVQREKPKIAMVMMQAVAIAIERPQPTTWPDVVKLLKWSSLRQAMHQARPENVTGAELALLTRLVKRTQHMDFQGLRCFNLSIKWLDAFEGAARYNFEHARVIQSENAVWKHHSLSNVA